MYAGLANCLFTWTTGFVAPESFTVTLSITLLAGIVIGGLGTVSGAVVGAVVVTFLPAPGLVSGLALILVLAVAPGGVTGLARRAAGVPAEGPVVRRLALSSCPALLLRVGVPS